ncbi:MAG: hypothetical protein LBB65_03170 [Burkholderiales bacterium]|nr:hypothetical protein [Burkholderiales bacterium]
MILDSWASFERNVATWVKSRVRPGIEFRNGYQAIPGFPSNRFRADALLTDGRSLLAVEVELKQANPDTNVGKYWLLSRYRQYDSVVLFHIFTPAYNSYPWRLDLGRFYAEKMQQELPFEYILMDHRKADNPEATLRQIQVAIESRIQHLGLDKV